MRERLVRGLASGWNSRIARSIVAVGSAAALSQAIQLALSPVLSRLYSQEAFGQFGALFGAANMAAALIALGLSDAIIAARDDRAALALAAAGLWITLVAAPLIAIGAALAIRFDVLGLGTLPATAPWLLMVETVLLVLILHLQMLLVRLRRFDGIARSYLSMGIVRAGGQTLGGAIGLGFLGLAGGEIAGRVASSGTMMRRLAAECRAVSAVGLAEMRAAVIAFRHFPLVRTPSALASAIGVGAPPILILGRFGEADAGSFSLMMMAVSAPLALIQKSIGDVFLGHFKQRLEADVTAARRLLLIAAGGLAALAIVGSAILLLWAPALFAFVFGAKWTQAGILAQAAVPMIAAQLVVLPVSTAILAANRPEAKIVYDVLFLGGLAVAYLLSQTPGATVTGFVAQFAALTAVATLCYLGLILWAASHPRAVADRVQAAGDVR